MLQNGLPNRVFICRESVLGTFKYSLLIRRVTAIARSGRLTVLSARVFLLQPGWVGLQPRWVSVYCSNPTESGYSLAESPFTAL